MIRAWRLFLSARAILDLACADLGITLHNGAFSARGDGGRSDGG